MIYLIREPSGETHRRAYQAADVAIIAAVGQTPVVAAERIARLAAGKTVRLGNMVWQQAPQDAPRRKSLWARMMGRG